MCAVLLHDGWFPRWYLLGHLFVPIPVTWQLWMGVCSVVEQSLSKLLDAVASSITNCAVEDTCVQLRTHTCVHVVFHAALTLQQC
jgi:hypothetical protein